MSDNIYINFWTLLLHIIFYKFEYNSFISYIRHIFHKTHKRKLFYIKIADDIYLKHLLKKVNNNYLPDLNNTVFIHKNTTHNGFAFIILKENNQIIKRLVQVIYTKNTELNNIYLNNILYHNLKTNTKKCMIIPIELNELKFANDVEITQINNPSDYNNFIIDSLLKNYFETPKLLYLNDIIAIDFNQHGTDLLHFASKSDRFQQIIYFKINKIVYKNNEYNGNLWCCQKQTNLHQIANIQNFIPLKPEKTYYPNGDLTLYPGGLEKYFQQILKATRIFLMKDNLQFSPVFLVKGPSGCGKTFLISALAAHLGMHLFRVSNHQITSNLYAQTESKLKHQFFQIKLSAPCIVLLNRFENFGKNNEDQYDERIINFFLNELKILLKNNQKPIIVFCTTKNDAIPIDMQRIFLEIFNIHPPNDPERMEMFQWILKSNHLKIDSNFEDLMKKTRGFVFEDLNRLVNLSIDYFNQQKLINNSEFDKKYFLKALDKMQKNYNETIGAPKIPEVHWEDIGGLIDIKIEIKKIINWSLKNPKYLKKVNLSTQSGILLFGPPGTGKTLLAKAVANECELSFLSVKGPELLNMYVGQSEQNIRDVFDKARQASPCIIFFDELDSLAPNRGKSGDSGGVMDRVVSQLLAEMDGLNVSSTIFIIGATNRPDLIDPALLRPGRFDKLLYIGPCTDSTSKLSVFNALTKRFRLSGDVDFDKIIELCPNELTGADLYGLCSNAWNTAVRKMIKSAENGSIVILFRFLTAFEFSETDIENYSHDNIVVTLDDFMDAAKNMKPSITRNDLANYEKLKQQFIVT